MGNKNRIPQPITKGVANVPVVMQLARDDHALL